MFYRVRQGIVNPRDELMASRAGWRVASDE